MRCFSIFLLATSLLSAEETVVCSGITYELVTQETPALIMHIVRIDPSLVVARPVRAWNFGRGREPLSSMARRTGAFVAINGGFFEMRPTVDGQPSGLLKISNCYYSLQHRPRGAIGWTDTKSPLFDRIACEATVRMPSGPCLISCFNIPDTQGKPSIYTHSLHSTLTPPGTQEITVTEEASFKDSTKGKVSAVSIGGDSPIPEGGFVISWPQITQNTPAHTGDSVTLHIRLTPQLHSEQESAWASMEHIVGGCPLLIADGKECHNAKVEQTVSSFYEGRHPRTAIGMLSDGRWLCLVVDGRQKKSQGMSIEELSHAMLKMGCVQALNLDGGGSSTLIIKDRLVNAPVDDSSFPDVIQERPISDAIVFFQKEEVKTPAIVHKKIEEP